MKILIITVGTRQVGWRGQDGRVRSFSAEGNQTQGTPNHINKIYQEFGVERGFHIDPNEAKDQYPWHIRHLGQLAYEQCVIKKDFSPVIFLLDEVIFADPVQQQELTHVILWGTNQPETVSWQFRRFDTLWLVKLMVGAIQERYPQLQVDLWTPELAVSDRQLPRVVEQLLIDYLQQFAIEDLTLQIQTKGGVPQVASALHLYAATLIRQCPVEQLNPVEPTPFFKPQTQEACCAEEFETLHLGEFFWPLERERILSAWKRGDFAEAKVWLSAHRDRDALYQLADRLTLGTNWQLEDMLKSLHSIHWIDHQSTKRCVPKHQRKVWREAIEARCKNNETPETKFLKIWDLELLIDLSLKRDNYTTAFLQFAQMLERLLFWRYETEKWREKGYLNPTEKEQNHCNIQILFQQYGTEKGQDSRKEHPSFGGLWRAWAKANHLSEVDLFVKNLGEINKLRNSVVHRNQAITRDTLAQIAMVANASSEQQLYNGLINILEKICAPHPKPQQGLLRSLYEWGLDQLQG